MIQKDLQLRHYDESERCAEGYLLYFSTYRALEAMAQNNPEDALQAFIALCRYNFYGEEYKGTNSAANLVFMMEKEHIDSQRVRYAKAKQGGRAGETIPFDTILSTIATGQYTTLASVGEALGTSGQNIGKRLKNQGFDFKQLVKQAQEKLHNPNETQHSNETVNFETFETNNETFETVSKLSKPAVSNEEDGLSQEFLAAYQQVKNGEKRYVDILLDLD